MRASIFIETSPRGSCTGDFGERETRQGGGGTRFLRTCSSDRKTPKAGRDRAVAAEAPRPLRLPALLSELSRGSPHAEAGLVASWLLYPSDSRALGR